jgi:hypothetical protein
VPYPRFSMSDAFKTTEAILRAFRHFDPVTIPISRRPAINQERQDIMKHPENVKYALVKRRPSAWRQGAKAAAVVAAIQATLSAMGDVGFGNIVLGAVVIFVVYWVFFSFLVWFWRALTDRYKKTPS